MDVMHVNLVVKHTLWLHCGEFLSESVQLPFSPNRLAKFAYKRINDEDEQAFDELVRRMIKYVTWFRVLDL